MFPNSGDGDGEDALALLMTGRVFRTDVAALALARRVSTPATTLTATSLAPQPVPIIHSLRSRSRRSK
jgi:hypothetical protein